MTTGMLDPRPGLYPLVIRPVLNEQKQEPIVVSEEKVSDERQETKNAVKKVVPRLDGPPGGYMMGGWGE